MKKVNLPSFMNKKKTINDYIKPTDTYEFTQAFYRELDDRIAKGLITDD